MKVENSAECLAGFGRCDLQRFKPIFFLITTEREGTEGSGLLGFTVPLFQDIR